MLMVSLAVTPWLSHWENVQDCSMYCQPHFMCVKSMRFLHFLLGLKGLFYRLFVYFIIFGFSYTLKLHCYIFVLMGLSIWFPWYNLKPIFDKQNLGLIIIRAPCISMQLSFPPKTCQ